MKKIQSLINRFLFPMVLMLVLLASCSDDDNDRSYQDARIVGVKVNNELFTPTYNESETIILLPAGRDLSNVKLQILVANGELIDMVNEEEYDARKPFDLVLRAENGKDVHTKLRIQSPPKLSLFIIEGLNVPSEDVHSGTGSLIVQVPEDTDLSALKVTMEFSNAASMDFKNGIELDYTDPRSFKVVGVDEETVYPYEFIITTEPVGPAFVRAMTIAGIETDSVTISDNNVLTPYVPALLDFTSVDVTFEVGFGNKVDPEFSTSGLNLLSGKTKVTITGSNGVDTEFTIATPQLSFAPLFAKKYDDLGFGGNDASALGFSGNKLLVANYSNGTKTPAIFDLTGKKLGQMDATDLSIASFGIRKFATDDKGAVIMSSLGNSNGEQWIYKFDNADAKGTKYISFSKATLGVDYDPRAAGINISGSLDGNAVITMGIAQKTDIFVWTVTNGVLNSTPKKYGFPYTGTSFYWSVQPMPIGTKGFIGFATTNGTEFPNGIVCFDENMNETQKLTGMVVTDGKTIKYNNRLYLAYTAHANSKGVMRICDITDGSIDSYKNPIFNQTMEVTGANANATTDADFAVIDGKLHVAFVCTNIGVHAYCLE